MNLFRSSILSLIVFTYLFGVDIKGDPKSWSENHFLGFDLIGDSNFETGDISSVFADLDNDNLYFRITFDDMFSRYNKKDLFEDQYISARILINERDITIIDQLIDISLISKSNNSYEFLRTPKYNLIEFKFECPSNINKKDLSFRVQIINQEQVIDEYVAYGNNDYRGGNAAFIHHGNQGLTYSEVFYGQEPLESSGFDEILEIHQATGIPGNFHLSGTLMPAAEWHNPEFNDWLSSGVNDGYVAMMTSALGQHMMPFVTNDMNNWSVSIETDMVEYMYGYSPKVAWVPERVWLSLIHI